MHLASMVLFYLCAVMIVKGQTEAAGMVIDIRRFEPESNLCRAGRAETVVAVLENRSEAEVDVNVRLSVPDGVRMIGGDERLTLTAAEQKLLRWTVEAAEECGSELKLEVKAEKHPAVHSSIRVYFMPKLDKEALTQSLKASGGYIPEPQPAQTEILIGAHHCPLWESDRPEIWHNVIKHPERTPALGFYSQGNPEIADWETLWAVEHGISFFIYCWYRNSQGAPVEMRFGSAIHDALFKSRYADRMQYAIMWENQVRGKAGVADEADLFDNLLPFWLENYFKHPSYLKLDNRPVLFVYRPEYLVQDLGSREAVAQAFDRMRRVCRAHGFDGLIILGEYRGHQPEHLTLLRDLGVEASFPYCWGIPGSPSPEQATATQMEYIRKQRDLGILPQVVTLSQAWSGWRDEGSIWKIPPDGFASLLHQAREFVETLPEGSIGRRMILLDNWNEWGEGHYIAPYREYGFGYLDAVRRVFASDAPPQVDLLPEDIGMGPYDRAIRGIFAERERLRSSARRLEVKPGADEAGLIGWWAFDEGHGEPVTLDYSGRRNGGVLLGAERAPGFDGRALVCTGGCVRVASDALFNVTTGLTVSCRVWTDVPGQSQAWIINRVQGGGENTGFRLGIMDGKPCFNVPVTDWSHTVRSDRPLPVGRWVQLTGTFDGQNLRIYIDGELCGTLPRSGPVGTNSFPIYLGSYSKNHSAHFKGLLDEVKIYSRVL